VIAGIWLPQALYLILGRVSFGRDEAPVMVDSDMGRLWWRRTPHPAVAGSPAWRGAAAYGAVVAVLGAGLFHYIPGPARGHEPSEPPSASAGSGHGHTVGAFHHIVLPDLAVIEPSGVTAAQLAAMGKVRGVRQVLALDGASVLMGGKRINVIGVDAQLYRSWTPLSTASNQQLWATLESGGFVASTHAQRRLRLHHGQGYSFTGATTVTLPYVGAAPLGIRGIDAVVAAQVSAKLGLIHHVATLISAPGLRINKLRREIRAAAGLPARDVVVLRPQAPAANQTAPAAPSSANRPTTYVQLFQESAALYCPGLPWTVLAAIGQIESGDGANMGPSTAGALGPMQFLPSTWATWGIDGFGDTGAPDVMNPFDAVPSAARLLCADGATSGGAGLQQAIFDYNHATWYVDEVLTLAAEYAREY
jgi:hypothetical protein